MKANHLVMWCVDKKKIESIRHKEDDTVWNVETLSESVKRDMGYHNCTRIHAASGYGCAFLDGNLSQIILDLTKYKPYLKFKFHPAGDLDRVGAVFEKMREGAQLPDMEMVLDTSIENFLG